jgi:hypothetical protein
MRGICLFRNGLVTPLRRINFLPSFSLLHVVLYVPGRVEGRGKLRDGAESNVVRKKGVNFV